MIDRSSSAEKRTESVMSPASRLAEMHLSFQPIAGTPRSPPTEWHVPPAASSSAGSGSPTDELGALKAQQDAAYEKKRVELQEAASAPPPPPAAAAAPASGGGGGSLEGALSSLLGALNAGGDDALSAGDAAGLWKPVDLAEWSAAVEAGKQQASAQQETPPPASPARSSPRDAHAPHEAALSPGGHSFHGAAGHGGFPLPDKAGRDALFSRYDYNGNGALSLAEIDKAIVESFPHFDNKPALMRAYKAADVDGNGWIGRREFRLLVQYIAYFNDLWAVFSQIDANMDGRIELSEFKASAHIIGIRMSTHEARAVFEQIDGNGGGFILFDEFCAWAARRTFDGSEVTIT